MRTDQASAQQLHSQLARCLGIEDQHARLALLGQADEQAGVQVNAARALALKRGARGWPDYTAAMPDDEILRRLLALNLERAAAG